MPDRMPIISMQHPQEQPPPPKRTILELVAIEVQFEDDVAILTIQPVAPHEAYVIPLEKEAAAELGRRLTAPSVVVASAADMPGATG